MQASGQRHRERPMVNLTRPRLVNLGTMRAELIGHFEPCMTEIYLHIDARMAYYIHTHPYTQTSHNVVHHHWIPPYIFESDGSLVHL